MDAARFLMAAGFPTDLGDSHFLEACRVPKIFIQSTHDQYGSPPEMEAFYAQVADPKRLIWMEAEDHFFAGGLDELERQVAALA